MALGQSHHVNYFPWKQRLRLTQVNNITEYRPQWLGNNDMSVASLSVINEEQGN